MPRDEANCTTAIPWVAQWEGYAVAGLRVSQMLYKLKLPLYSKTKQNQKTYGKNNQHKSNRSGGPTKVTEIGGTQSRHATDR